MAKLARFDFKKDYLKRYLPRNNDFYRKYYHHFLYGVMVILVIFIASVFYVLHQMMTIPPPTFSAVSSDGKEMKLTYFITPNLLPDTILTWATKGATLAYSFDYAHYNDQLALARPFFTEQGWADYRNSVSSLIDSIVKNQLFVNGVASGPAVISNQGPIKGKGYAWRVQIPFLVTYQSANATTQSHYYVVLTLVSVPTYINPQGIGIDQFLMV